LDPEKETLFFFIHYDRIKQQFFSPLILSKVVYWQFGTFFGSSQSVVTGLKASFPQLNFFAAEDLEERTKH